MAQLLLAFLFCVPLLAQDWFLFTSFRKNGETGVYFALSQDGRKWLPLNDNQSWIQPKHEGMLMRDPFLVKGPDGVWHMLWTPGWNRKELGGNLSIGYASSKDLVNWSEQRLLPVMTDEPEARNAWAPEAAWDPDRKEWVLFWASTIPGRFPDTEGAGDDGYNHRMYAMTTKDWLSFSPARLWFNPGFNCIDSTLVEDGNRWIMVFKDERRKPQQKRLRLAFADSPQGPWHGVTEPFTRDWVEGPSAVQIQGEWWIYFDHYTKPRHYGAVRTRDWKTFEDMTRSLSFPEDHRHGTVVRVDAATAKMLRGTRQPKE